MSFGRAWRQILISKERKGKRKRTIELNNVTRRTKEHYRKPLVSQGFLKEKEVSDKEKSLKFKRLEGKPTKTRGISISSCFLMLLYGLSVCSYGFWSFGVWEVGFLHSWEGGKGAPSTFLGARPIQLLGIAFSILLGSWRALRCSFLEG